MQDRSLLSKYNLKTNELFKLVNETHYLRLAGPAYRERENQVFFIRKEKEELENNNMEKNYMNPRLALMGKREKSAIIYKKLEENQKARLRKLHGSYKKIHARYPFSVKDTLLLDISKNNQFSRKGKPKTELDFSQKLLIITRQLKDFKPRDDYILETNPFIPRLTTEALINFKMENYLNIVKNPMSLTDVHEKVQMKLYNTIEEYESDVLLMVNNATLYHGENSVYDNYGRKMLEYYYKLKNQYFK